MWKMTDSDGDRKINLETVDADVDARYSQIMKANHGMQLSMRRKASQLIQEAEKFDMMAARLRELAAVHVETAQTIADSVFHILSSEFDLIVEDDEDEAPDDSEDER